MSHANGLATRILKAGTIIKIDGFPVELQANVEVMTHVGNWKSIDELAARRLQALGDEISAMSRGQGEAA